MMVHHLSILCSYLELLYYFYYLEKVYISYSRFYCLVNLTDAVVECTTYREASLVESNQRVGEGPWKIPSRIYEPVKIIYFAVGPYAITIIMGWAVVVTGIMFS